MGLSNAERQKRYREKLKAAARGNVSANLAPASGDGGEVGRGAFVRAIAARYEAIRADPDYDQAALDVVATVADDVWRVLVVLECAGVQPGDELDRNEAVIIDALGGLEYALAVKAWKDAKGRGREKKRTNLPPPPPLPV